MFLPNNINIKNQSFAMGYVLGGFAITFKQVSFGSAISLNAC